MATKKKIQDSTAFKIALAVQYRKELQNFLDSEDTKKIRRALLEYGIKEPYAGNIIERLWIQAYKVLKT